MSLNYQFSMATDKDWYWQSSDSSRTYSGKRNAIVKADDADFVGWTEKGGIATPWPKDEDGKESDDALAAILKAYDVYFHLGDYAAFVRWTVEISGVTAKIDGKLATVSTKREDRDGLRDTLSAIMAGLRKDGATFKFEEGPRTATNDEMKAVIASAFQRVQSAYDKEGEVVAGIANGTIKTAAEVDEAFASIR